MDLRWLRQTGSGEVVVVFGGWGVGPQPFEALGGAQDVLFVRDYRDLSTELPDLAGYDRRSLVAWSFGVASFGHWQQGRRLNFDRKVAVNGTLTPVNRLHGVPPSALQLTLDTLSEQSFQRFLGRCFNARQPSHAVDVPALRDELEAVRERGDAPDLRFDRIWIGEADRIFPPANMTRVWASQADVVRRIDGPHAPFAQFTDWEALLS